MLLKGKGAVKLVEENAERAALHDPSDGSSFVSV